MLQTQIIVGVHFFKGRIVQYPQNIPRICIRSCIWISPNFNKSSQWFSYPHPNGRRRWPLLWPTPWRPGIAFFGLPQIWVIGIQIFGNPSFDPEAYMIFTYDKWWLLRDYIWVYCFFCRKSRFRGANQDTKFDCGALCSHIKKVSGRTLELELRLPNDHWSTTRLGRGSAVLCCFR